MLRLKNFFRIAGCILEFLFIVFLFAVLFWIVWIAYGLVKYGGL